MAPGEHIQENGLCGYIVITQEMQGNDVAVEAMRTCSELAVKLDINPQRECPALASVFGTQEGSK